MKGTISTRRFPILGSGGSAAKTMTPSWPFSRPRRPVRYTPPKNDLTFPLNFRSMVKGWNHLYLNSQDFQADPGQSAEWNRGAYLVNGLGHCGGCHTPKNAFGADKSKLELYGATLDNWVAPDLTGNDRTGLGSWSIDDIAEYLHTGRNRHAGAGGAMADVITYSTSLLSDADRRAMAVYLKSRTASPSVADARPDSGSHAPRRRHLFGRLCVLPPGKRGRSTAVLSAARTECHAAAGRPDRA